MRARYGRMIMCHMLADTVEELHAMADKIGIQRRWFQEKSTPHYDISLGKRDLAIAYGAVVADQKMVVAIIRKYRQLV